MPDDPKPLDRMKIFNHKHLDWNCVQNGCQSEVVIELQRQLAELQAAINLDGSLTEHDEFVSIATEGAEALIRLSAVCEDNQELKRRLIEAQKDTERWNSAEKMNRERLISYLARYWYETPREAIDHARESER